MGYNTKSESSARVVIDKDIPPGTTTKIVVAEIPVGRKTLPVSM